MAFKTVIGKILKAVLVFGAPYVARLPKSPTHVVSPYSEETAECILRCNSTYAHGMFEQYII
ncbi:hypothetical protein AB205_0096090 [Aquarana catesbeiana]|uniref:Uncharacterized protein n=1 Tax=Aquarana catesbeiana TaxID=8400 RepID=A0A2G9Q3Y9_AQUCT|nr:hypothetical protein AB205_0096090 [Aquarana catesbeiana]